MHYPLWGIITITLMLASGVGLYVSLQTESKEPYRLEALPDSPSPTATTRIDPVRHATSPKTSAVSGKLVEHPNPLHTYLEITEGCHLVVDDTCSHAYADATSTALVRKALRVGTVLAVKQTFMTVSGEVWHEIHFPETLRYSSRLTLPWFVPASAGTIVKTAAPADQLPSTPTTSKRIIVDRSDQTLEAYAGNILVFSFIISTGRELTPTPRGTFTVFRKTPSRYMQGPIPGISTNYYDLPGVPWNLYFTKQGAVIHGAYWHDNFGHPHSNGCVNLRPQEARTLYDWAELGTTVTVQD